MTPEPVTGKVVVASTGAGRRRRPGRAVLVGQRRRAGGQRGDRRRAGRTPSAGCRPAATGVRVHAAPASTSSGTRRRMTFADATDIEVADGPAGRARGHRDRRSAGQRRGRGRRRRPDRRRRPPRRAGRRRRRTPNALVDEVAVSADGSFLFEDVPSPANYQLIVDKPGFATEVRDVVLRRGPGARRHRGRAARGRRRRLRPRAAARSGRSAGSTVDGHRRRHRGLDGQPDARRRRVLRRAHAADARAVHADVRARRATSRRRGPSTSAAGQQLAGPGRHAGPDDGLDLRHGQPRRPGPVGGVTVTVTGPDVEHVDDDGERRRRRALRRSTACPCRRRTRSRSPRPGCVSQTRLEDLDPLAGRADAHGHRRPLVPSTATVGGIVRDAGGAPVAGATVVLSDGSETRELLSADDPLGRFEFCGVEPGAYTLTRQPAGHVAGGAARQRHRRRRRRPRRSASSRRRRCSGGCSCSTRRPGSSCRSPGRASVRLVRRADDFPGAASAGDRDGAADADGRLHVHQPRRARTTSSSPCTPPTASADALDSVLVQTQPSAAVEVPTFQHPAGH